MKKTLIVLIILFGIYFLAAYFPSDTFKYEWNNTSIALRITENYLVFRDPEYRKHVTIIEGENKLVFSFWSDTRTLKIHKRKNKSETFWIINDFYRGMSRSKKGVFQKFICPDCSGIETTYGEDVLTFQFENKKLKRLH